MGALPFRSVRVKPLIPKPRHLQLGSLRRSKQVLHCTLRAGLVIRVLWEINLTMATRSHLPRLFRNASHALASLAPSHCITSHSASNAASSGTFLQQCRTFVQMRTRLEVADNSGAKRVSCIKVLGGGKHGKLGDLIIASVKDAVPRGKVKKGEVVNCVIVRAAMHRQRSDGSEIRFDKNAVVIVNKQGEPIGTRIFGPVPHELRMKNFMKILTLADHVT